jgi:hypothetical protein
VVYLKPPFGNPQHVLRYLAAYTHRVAISNHRLVAFQHEQVSFRWNDYAYGNKKRLMSCPHRSSCDVSCSISGRQDSCAFVFTAFWLSDDEVTCYRFTANFYNRILNQLQNLSASPPPLPSYAAPDVHPRCVFLEYFYQPSQALTRENPKSKSS